MVSTMQASQDWLTDPVREVPPTDLKPAYFRRGNNQFQDLLSAVLDESGLADDFQDFGAEAVVPSPQVVHRSPIVQTQHVTSLATSAVPGVMTPRASTPLQQHQVARVMRAMPASGSVSALSPGTGNVRRLVVRAVRPQTISTQPGQAVQVIRQPIRQPVPQQAQVISGKTVHMGQVQVVQGPQGPVRVIRVTPRSGTTAAGTPVASLANVIGQAGTQIVSSSPGTPTGTLAGGQTRTRIVQLAKAPDSGSGTPVQQRFIQVGNSAGSPTMVNVGGVNRQLIQPGSSVAGMATTVDANGVRRQIIRLDGNRGAALSQTLSNLNPNAVRAQIVRVTSSPTATSTTVRQQAVVQTSQVQSLTPGAMVTQIRPTAGTPRARIPVKISNIAGQGGKIMIRQSGTSAATNAAIPRTIKLVNVPQKNTTTASVVASTYLSTASPRVAMVTAPSTVPGNAAPNVRRVVIPVSSAPMVNAVCSGSGLGTLVATHSVALATTTAAMATTTVQSLVQKPVCSSNTPAVASGVVMALPDETPSAVVSRVTQPSAVVPMVTQPSAVVPMVTQPSAVVSVVTQPSAIVTKPSAVVSMVTQPSVVVPMVTQPSAVLSMVTQPSAVVPVVTQPSAIVSMVTQPSAVVTLSTSVSPPLSTTSVVPPSTAAVFPANSSTIPSEDLQSVIEPFLISPTDNVPSTAISSQSTTMGSLEEWAGLTSVDTAVATPSESVVATPSVPCVAFATDGLASAVQPPPPPPELAQVSVPAIMTSADVTSGIDRTVTPPSDSSLNSLLGSNSTPVVSSVDSSVHSALASTPMEVDGDSSVPTTVPPVVPEASTALVTQASLPTVTPTPVTVTQASLETVTPTPVTVTQASLPTVTPTPVTVTQASLPTVTPTQVTMTATVTQDTVSTVAQETTVVTTQEPVAPAVSVVSDVSTSQPPPGSVMNMETDDNQDESGMDMFGGADVDMFSQALMMLQDTNVKAKEFEDYQKSQKPLTPPPAPAAPVSKPLPVSTPPVVPSNPSVTMPTSIPAASAVTMPTLLPGVTTPVGVPVTMQQFRPIAGPMTVMSTIDSPEPLTQYRIGSSPLTVQRVSSPLQGVNVNTAQRVNVNTAQRNSPILVQRVGSPLTLGSSQLVQLVGRSASPITVQHPRQIITSTQGRTSVGNHVVRVLPGISSAPPGGGLQSILAGRDHTSGVSSPLGGLSMLAMNPTKGPIIPIAKTASAAAGNGVIKKELTDKDVSRMWANDEIKLKKLAHASGLRPGLHPSMSSPALMRGEVLEEEEAEEEEELGHAETYAEYMPAKLKLGTKHPDSVVETSSLSSVEPANIYYRVSIPENIIDCGFLSALQLEAITYAAQKHETFLPSGERAGFLIGDGAGVGKGRTIAGIIYENYLLGRKRSLWLSVSNDLRIDAERDLRDIGAGKIEVHPLNKFKYAKISSHINGSVKKGVVFATYSSLIGESQSESKYRTRLKQLIHWLGKDFDGAIIFDECHKAKNLCPVGSSKPTKTGKTVLDLQNKLPKARIVYASATGASEPRNMAYMQRLGLWGLGTPFREFSDFIQAVEKRGVGAMELVAMEMKLRGMYMARQLSFKGVSFKIEEIPIPRQFYKIYNKSVRLWVDARDKFQRALDIMDPEHRLSKSMWGQFWSSHQRFFKYLCISAKVPHCVRIARDAIKNGKCVVIGLQSTGEARTLEQLEESGGELNDFVSTAKGVFQTLVEKHFPAPNRRKTNSLFGLGPSLLFDDSPVPSPKTGSKRKNHSDRRSDAKKVKWQVSSGSSSDSSGDSDSSDDDNSGTDKGKENQKADTESDISLSESDEEDDEEEDDFNPFGNGSDSDDDPWLKKKKASKAKKNTEKEKKAKEKEKEKERELQKKKKKKEKKNKKKKKKKSKKRKDGWDDDDDDDDDIDAMEKQMDRALEAAGLKPASSNSSVSKVGSSQLPGMDDVDRAISMKQELLDKIDELDDLPANTLDELIDQLGGTEYVAEMTGRKGRVVSTDDGVQYESRSESDVPLEILNLTEKQRFMDGEKDIAIISEAASSGISLQADRRAVNQKRRVHLTLELPWSADRAIQQFGRTHRSNQVSAPEYLFLISELAGERRFASTVAKRLESLGALTHGDRRATESRDLSRFNIDNKYGRAALESIMKAVVDLETPLVRPPVDYQGNFFHDCKVALVGVGMVTYDERYGIANLEKDYNNISKFLNRILGMEVDLQNTLFKYFTDTLEAVILQAKRNGRWDMGILDLGSGEEKVKRTDTRTFAGVFSGSKTKTELHTIVVERGTSWEQGMQIWRDHSGADDGFYLATQMRNNKKTAVLVIGMSGRKREKLYRLYRPNTGLQPRSETLEEIKKKYRKVYPDDAMQWWNDQYDASANVCTHAYWRGYCRKASAGLPCEMGLRARTYYVLGGSVLSVWNTVEGVLASLPGGHATRMQIIRMRTDEGKRIVGSLIPPSALDILINVLTQEANKSKTGSSGGNPSTFGGSGGILGAPSPYGGGAFGRGGVYHPHQSMTHSSSMTAIGRSPATMMAPPVKTEPSQQQQQQQQPQQPQPQRQYISMPTFV